MKIFPILAAALLAGRTLFAAETSVSGITEPFMDVTLSSSVPGIIALEKFKEGDVVKAGDVILELDRKLEELETQRRKQVMERAKADMESTAVLLKNTKSVSKDEMEKKETDYQVAFAEHGIAAEQLARRQIIAPFAGSITEVFLHRGAACEPYQPLIRLVDVTRCYFVGHVDGLVAAKIKLNKKVQIKINGSDAVVSGTVSFISPVVDPASGLARVKAVFDNADGKIRPGLAATLQLD